MLVTVIIPAYNAEKYIAETLDCILKQTYKELEVLCINDGSTDNTEQIIKSYIKKDNRVKLHNQENKGLPATRNVGIDLAKGDLITFIDADDTCSLNTIESSVKLIEQNNSDMVINFLDHRPTVKNKPIGEFAYLSTWQLVIKKSLLDSNPDVRCDEDLTMGEDVVFCHKLLTLTDNISKNYDSTLNYRIHAEQMSNIKNDSEFIKHIGKCYGHVVDYYNNRNIWEIFSCHFVRFLMEYPFTYYLKCKWNYQDKKYVFDLIHKIIKEKNLKTKIKITNSREFAFYLFMISPNVLFYEPVRIFASYIYNRKKKRML